MLYSVRIREGTLQRAGRRLLALRLVLIDLALHRAAVEAEAARRLLVAARLGVDERAVAREQLVRGELARAQRGRQLRLGMPVARRRRAVLAADEDVAHALLELAHVAGPGVARPEVFLDPRLHLVGERLGLLVAHQAAREEEDQVRELVGRLAELLGE